MCDPRRCWIVAVITLAAFAAACGSSSERGDRAHRQGSATGSAATPNPPAESVGTGAVTCMGGELLVANSAGPAGAITAAANDVTVYDRTASGDIAPLRTIAGPSTGFVTAADAYAPRDLATDGVHGELFATAGDAIVVFARDAAGDAAPLRTIVGPATGLTIVERIALDLANDELFVLDGGRILVFARDASGDVAPLRTLTGAAPLDLAVDEANGELIVLRAAPSVAVYARTATGAATPLRTIAGAATTLTSPRAVAFDATRGEIVVVGVEPGGSARCALISGYCWWAWDWARTTSGNAAPLHSLLFYESYDPTHFDVVADGAGGEILWAATASAFSTIRSFTHPTTAGANGHAALLRTLSGDATGLSWARSVAFFPGTASCAAGAECAQGGCMPAGMVDCLNGHYCPSGTLCGLNPGFCITGMMSPAVQVGADLCRLGTTCPAGWACASGGCMPVGGGDCGTGKHCPAASVCSGSGPPPDVCVPGDAANCFNGRYCPSGSACIEGGQYCLPPGATECGVGFYCDAGEQCQGSGGSYTCLPPPPPPGGDYCYSTSACIPSVMSDTCSCGGSTTPGQCVSGHPACSRAGGVCGDGTHACCVGETCINGLCVTGCGQCAGKGCVP
jgi:hypothetical protein